MLHGVMPTPTQVLIFVAAAGAAGTGVGPFPHLFVIGLLVANTVIALAVTSGYLAVSNSAVLGGRYHRRLQRSLARSSSSAPRVATSFRWLSGGADDEANTVLITGCLR
jgi:hypothetical protein